MCDHVGSYNVDNNIKLCTHISYYKRRYTYSNMSLSSKVTRMSYYVSKPFRDNHQSKETPPRQGCCRRVPTTKEALNGTTKRRFT